MCSRVQGVGYQKEKRGEPGGKTEPNALTRFRNEMRRCRWRKRIGPMKTSDDLLVEPGVVRGTWRGRDLWGAMPRDAHFKNGNRFRWMS